MQIFATADTNRLRIGLDSAARVGYAGITFAGHLAERITGVKIMEWTAPAFEEVCLNCEINSYASAKL